LDQSSDKNGTYDSFAGNGGAGGRAMTSLAGGALTPGSIITIMVGAAGGPGSGVGNQRGDFAAIQAAVDAGLLAAGITAIRSWVVDGPGATAMAAAIIARGGAKVGEQQVGTATGAKVTYHEYLRPLVAAEVRP
jgi:hypothetical protein